MAYTNKTAFYDIPVIAGGEKITGHDEMAQMGIIDSLLYAACFGTSRMIFNEGTYSVNFNEEGTGAELVITPSASSSGYSLLGIINKRLFYSTDTLRIGRLTLNTMYYVYVEYTQSLDINPSLLNIEFYDEEQDKSPFLIPLCIVTTTPGAPVVDLDVDKPNATQILAHASLGNNTNPHGETISQRNLKVIDTIDMQNDGTIHGAVYMSYTTGSSEYELPLTNGQVPVFIDAYPESTSAGQIAWRISSGKAYLSNSGSAGITVNLRIETENI